MDIHAISPGIDDVVRSIGHRDIRCRFFDEDPGVGAVLDGVAGYGDIEILGFAAVVQPVGPDRADLVAVVTVSRSCTQQHIVLNSQGSGHRRRIDVGSEGDAAARAHGMLMEKLRLQAGGIQSDCTIVKRNRNPRGIRLLHSTLALIRYTEARVVMYKPDRQKVG